eukprot:TRINITY_DN70980_c0_g1_i1.p1 TRINITY_DN70980_c0_g1~~TRINITY_DN70980_c0_g1_i1.p1  ORF type:complete len:513 (+),score=170.85 TRINITY_DN70980_c0_g1_i1:91-1539(+)
MFGGGDIFGGGAEDAQLAAMLAEIARAAPGGDEHRRFSEEGLEELTRYAPGDTTGGVGREVGKRWFDSARYGDFVTMQDLLPLNAHLIHYRGQGTSYGFIGSTALHWAAARGNLKMMRWLLDKGADPSAQNYGGSTPLHSASSNGQVPALELLLAHGANTTLADCCGDLCEEVAAPDKAAAVRAAVGRWRVGERLRKLPREQWKARDMKEALRAAGVDIRGITERSELVEQVQKLLDAVSSATAPSATEAHRGSAAPSVQLPTQLAADGDDRAQKAAEEAKEKGNKAFRDGDHKTAVRCYTLAITLWPHDATFYTNRAATYMALRQFRRALEDGAKAVELRPDWPKGHYRRGCALLQLGQPLEAVWAFNTAHKLCPEPSQEIVDALQYARKAAEEAEAEQAKGAGSEPSSDDDCAPRRPSAAAAAARADSSPERGRSSSAGVEDNLAARFPHVPRSEIVATLERHGWHGGRAAQELRKLPAP